MQQPLRTQKRRQHFVEAVAITLLSCAGVATSWSGYQASRWGGVQATSYSRASALRLESTRASSSAEQLRAIHVAVFMAWVEAYGRGDETLQQFYRARMRPELEVALHTWLESRPRDNPSAALTPFHLPEYRLAKDDEAAALATQAQGEFRAGEDANEASDAYVLNAVLLATVLFFAGISQQFRVFGVRAALLVAATALFALGAWNIFLYPKI